MATSYFTPLCAFFRSSFNKALLLWVYRSSPNRFIQILALRLCGRHVFVSRFPSLVPGFSQVSGWYFVSSIIIDHTGGVELGLSLGDDIDYYHFFDIDIDMVK
jgi:hypothetical protein